MGGGGECTFSIYFVQNKMDQQPQFPQTKDEAARRKKRAIFPSLIGGGGGGGGGEGGV